MAESEHEPGWCDSRTCDLRFFPPKYTYNRDEIGEENTKL